MTHFKVLQQLLRLSTQVSKPHLLNIMKKIVNVAFALGVTSFNVNAFNITVANLEGSNDTAVPIVDNTGAAIANGTGFIASGTFDVAPGAGPLTSLAGFSPFGDGSTSFSGGPANGLFSNTRNLPLPLPGPGETNDPLVGQDIFVVIGNGDSIATSTLFAVIDGGAQIQNDQPAPAQEGAVEITIVNSFIDEANLINGNLLENVVIDGVPVTFQEGIQLTPLIPEPSTTLLGLVAGLGFLVRRRR